MLISLIRSIEINIFLYSFNLYWFDNSLNYSLILYCMIQFNVSSYFIAQIEGSSVLRCYVLSVYLGPLERRRALSNRHGITCRNTWIFINTAVKTSNLAVFVKYADFRFGDSKINFAFVNPLKPELNPICYLLALLGAHHFLHVSRIRVKLLTFRLLMS